MDPPSAVWGGVTDPPPYSSHSASGGHVKTRLLDHKDFQLTTRLCSLSMYIDGEWITLGGRSVDVYCRGGQSVDVYRR